MIALLTAALHSQARLGAQGRLFSGDRLVGWSVLCGPRGPKDKARGQSTLFIYPQHQHFWVFRKLLCDDVLIFKASLRGASDHPHSVRRSPSEGPDLPEAPAGTCCTVAACVDAARALLSSRAPLARTVKAHSPPPWILMEPRPRETAKCWGDREGGQAPPALGPSSWASSARWPVT